MTEPPPHGEPAELGPLPVALPCRHLPSASNEVTRGPMCSAPVRRAPLKGWPQGVWLGMGLAGCDPPLPVSPSLGSRRKMSPEDGQREGSHYQQELPIQGI